MAITFQNVLPDPNYNIGDAGQASTGDYGPGFKSVKLTSETKIAKNITNSGRVVRRYHGNHNWNIDITYNPMTRAEFEPVYNFLLERQHSLKPFFVSLPHLRTPQSTSFATHVGSNNITVPSLTASGTSTLLIGNCGDTGASQEEKEPKPGDLFTITDSNDVAHLKAYQVVRTERNTAGMFDGLQPGATQRKIAFIPPLTKEVSTSALVNFSAPLIRVIMNTDIQEYALNTEGLYQFSLKLREAQP